MKKHKILYTLVLLIIAGILIVSCIILMPKKLTGEQWFVEQSKYMSSMQSISTSLDNIVSLYLNSNINENDYIDNMRVIKQEMDILNKSYSEDEEKTPVKVGTHTYDSKSGVEAVQNMMKQLTLLIDNCLDPAVYQDKDNLSYSYIAYTMSISAHANAYQTAYKNILIKYKDSPGNGIGVREKITSEEDINE